MARDPLVEEHRPHRDRRRVSGASRLEHGEALVAGEDARERIVEERVGPLALDDPLGGDPEGGEGDPSHRGIVNPLERPAAIP